MVSTSSERADRLVERLFGRKFTKQELDTPTEVRPPTSIRERLADQRKGSRRRMRQVRKIL